MPSARILRQAALYFLAVHSGRAARKVPRFAREQAPGDNELDLILELEEADWNALEEEAEDQQVSLERLLVHAVLLLLADLDSGRVAVRILEDEEEDEEEL